MNDNSIKPTDEQARIIEGAGKHTEMMVNATAGSGKSSVMCMIAAEHPVNSLLLTFNKALAVEASEKFPSWVSCRTTHSLAYGHFGVGIQHKLKRPQGAYRNVAGTGTEIAKYFKTGDFIYLLDGEHETRTMKAGGVGVAIKETVAKYEASADTELTMDHVSVSPCEQCLLRDKRALKAFKRLVFAAAQRLWSLRIDSNSDVLATHDTYLKLYQLSKPDLSMYKNIYLDEMQDSTAVVLDIFTSQQGKANLYGVGDPYQNIYSWRFAQNAMLKFDWPEYGLTQSFRFGQRVADIANCVLAKDGRLITDIKGWDKLDTRTVLKYDIEGGVLDQPYTALFRTNSALIFEAVDLLSEGRTVNLEIDVNDFTKFLESAIELKRGNKAKVKYEKLVQFDTWVEFGTEAEAVQGELLRVFNMVNNGTVFKVLDVLSKHKNVADPQVTLTTAHKAKGREWDIVILADDFASPYNAKGEWIGLQDAERNLLYVALTRAKSFLGYNDTVQQMINRVHGGLSTPDCFDLEKEIREIDRELEYTLDN